MTMAIHHMSSRWIYNTLVLIAQTYALWEFRSATAAVAA